jgi:hypothetical protein
MIPDAHEVASLIVGAARNYLADGLRLAYVDSPALQPGQTQGRLIDHAQREDKVKVIEVNVVAPPGEPLLVGLVNADLLERPIEEWLALYRDRCLDWFGGREGLEQIVGMARDAWDLEMYQRHYWMESMDENIRRCQKVLDEEQLDEETSREYTAEDLKVALAKVKALEEALSSSAPDPATMTEEETKERIEQQQRLSASEEIARSITKSMDRRRLQDMLAKMKAKRKAVDNFPEKNDAYWKGRIWYRTKHVLKSVWDAFRPYMDEESRTTVHHPQTDLTRAEFADVQPDVLFHHGWPHLVLEVAWQNLNDGKGALQMMAMTDGEPKSISMQDVADINYRQMLTQLMSSSIMGVGLLLRTAFQQACITRAGGPEALTSPRSLDLYPLLTPEEVKQILPDGAVPPPEFNAPTDTRRYDRQAHVGLFGHVDRWRFNPGQLRIRLLFVAEDFNVLDDDHKQRLLTTTSVSTAQLQNNPYFRQATKEVREAMLKQFEELQEHRRLSGGQ